MPPNVALEVIAEERRRILRDYPNNKTREVLLNFIQRLSERIERKTNETRRWKAKGGILRA